MLFLLWVVFLRMGAFAVTATKHGWGKIEFRRSLRLVFPLPDSYNFTARSATRNSERGEHTVFD